MLKTILTTIAITILLTGCVTAHDEFPDYTEPPYEDDNTLECKDFKWTALGNFCYETGKIPNYRDQVCTVWYYSGFCKEFKQD